MKTNPIVSLSVSWLNDCVFVFRSRSFHRYYLTVSSYRRLHRVLQGGFALSIS